MHCFISNLNAPVLKENNVDEYVSFVDKTVYAYLPNKMKTLICMNLKNRTNSIGIPKHAANIEMMVVDLTLENSFQTKP